MTRFLLALVVVLSALIVAERVRTVRADRASSADTGTAPRPAPQRTKLDSAPPKAAEPLPVESRTPASDLIARVDARRRLLHAARATYFDSLFAETDSLVRRWPDRDGNPLVVGLLSSGDAALDARVRRAVEGALRAWEGAGPALRFTLQPDTVGAQVTVEVSDLLEGDRAGETDLRWTEAGSLLTATVRLALKSPDGRPIPDAGLLAVAIHEVGHALGMPHSAVATDAMFPTTRTTALSTRDRSTYQLLYELPTGSIREPGRQ